MFHYSQLFTVISSREGQVKVAVFQLFPSGLTQVSQPDNVQTAALESPSYQANPTGSWGRGDIFNSCSFILIYGLINKQIRFIASQ